MKRSDIAELEQALGYSFRNQHLLVRALTHSSHAHEEEMRSPGAAAAQSRDNEQLEFLGDAVLGLVASEELVRRFPTSSEGQLSKLRAHLVSARYLVDVARQLGLGRHLLLGRGEERSGGREKSALLSDALEAVLAAIYLDSGMEEARRFVLSRVVEPELERIQQEDIAGESALTDHKSALQELLQATGRPQPAYAVVSEQGPEHRKTFTVEVRMLAAGSGDSEIIGRAEGSTKKRAEQLAAREALQFLQSQQVQAAPLGGRQSES